MLTTDLNCDMGESTSLWPYSLEKDIQLLRWVSSINLACGYHAGDAHTMHELADAALTAGVAVGAHPGFADRDNFGRSNISLPPGKIYDLVVYQLGALDAFLKIHGARLHHVKPHGALYNMAAGNRVMADAICRAVKDYDERLILYGLSGSELVHAATAAGLKSSSEVFADRSYRADGSLTPRSEPNAMIESAEASVQQVLKMVQAGKVNATNGEEVPIVADTICIHGDGEQALVFAQQLHTTLKQAGIDIRSI